MWLKPMQGLKSEKMVDENTPNALKSEEYDDNNDKSGGVVENSLCGFCLGRNTTNQIFTLKQSLRNSERTQKMFGMLC